jgi:outer membrane biosynthesis protein TonB
MTQNFSTRMVAKGFLCAAVAVLVLLWSLLLVGTAGADPVQEQAGEVVPPIETVQPANGQAGEGASSETTTPSESGTEPVQEGAGEPGAEQGSDGGEATAPEEPSPPAGETTPETVAEPETVVEPEPVVAPVKETVAEPVLEHVSETVVPVEPVVEHVKEVVTPVIEPVIEPVKEQANELLSSLEPTKELVAGAGMSSGSGPGTQTGGGAAVASAPATEASDALVASLLAPSTGGGPGEPPTASTAPASISGVPTHLTAAQRAGELSCQLSGLGGAATDNCTASWLSSEPLLVSAPGGLVLAARARAGSPAGSSQGGSGGGFGGSRSFLPPPGPAPTGAVGGSAAGGSGVGLSGFFTLAGLLLLAGPRALRRLRLSSKPWLTAFFVLIPERPG